MMYQMEGHKTWLTCGFITNLPTSVKSILNPTGVKTKNKQKL